VAALLFDTSALVKRYDLAEAGARRVRALCRLSSGHTILIAPITAVELAAALNRKVREGRFGPVQRDLMWRLFLAHRRQRYHTLALDNPLYDHAARLPFAHPLRGYDAVQLACGLYARRLLAAVTSDVRLCTADQRLATAAAVEGLLVEFIP